MSGSWKKGRGIELFESLSEKMGKVPIVAEDLGVITRDVVELREATGFPGMVVLQFAWEGGPGNTHLPINHYSNSFCYPGTHDNETAVGWWRETASDQAKANLSSYCGGSPPGPDGSGVNWMLIEAAMWSVSNCAVALMQDIIGLDNATGRMNTPGKAEGNWAWRIGDSGVWERLKPEAKRLEAIVKASGRKAKE
jgi:4-alpha-glucanotransferase